MSGNAILLYRTLCPGGTCLGRTLARFCRTMSDVRRLFSGLYLALRIGQISYQFYRDLGTNLTPKFSQGNDFKKNFKVQAKVCNIDQI